MASSVVIVTGPVWVLRRFCGHVGRRQRAPCSGSSATLARRRRYRLTTSAASTRVGCDAVVVFRDPTCSATDQPRPHLADFGGEGQEQSHQLTGLVHRRPRRRRAFTRPGGTTLRSRGALLLLPREPAAEPFELVVVAGHRSTHGRRV